MPGFVRVPPPFGPPRDAVRAINAAQARASRKQTPATWAVGRQPPSAPWRQRLTVVAIGVACTVTAALIGSHTGQRRQPLPHFDQASVRAIAQAPAPIASPEMLPVEAVRPVPANENAARPAKIAAVATAPSASAAADSPAIAYAALTAAQSPAKVDKPRTLAKATGRTVTSDAPTRPATSTHGESEAAETYRAMTEAPPISSGYVVPGAPAHIDLQRHTRLTD